MGRLAALALFLTAAPVAAQTPAPPVPDDVPRLGEDWYEEQREFLDGARERLAERLRDTTVALRGRCDAGVPMPRLYGPGGAAPAPMPEVELGGPGPVPMPNPCGAVAAAAPAVRVRRWEGPPVRLRPERVPPRWFPPAAPPPDER